MIYNDKFIDREVNNYRKLSSLLDVKKYLFYGLIAFLLSRINVLFYMAPIGIAFAVVCILKNNKIFSTIVCLSSILGYLSTKQSFVSFDIYIIINFCLMAFSFLKINFKYKNILVLSIVVFLIFVYKYFNVGFSLTSSMFSVIFEISAVIAFYFVFNNFIKVTKYFNTNQIFVRDEVICLILTLCLSFCGFNNFKIFSLDLSNILLMIFIFIISYVNGMSIGMVSAVFSGIIIGIMYGDVTQYIAIYSLLACISSILYLSSRFSIVIVCSLSVFILGFSNMSLFTINQKYLLMEVMISMMAFLIIPKNILNKVLIHFDEENKKEFYSQKRLFNTLDMRIQKLDDFNNSIKELSDMIVSNVNFKYKILDKKIYIEILAESVCSECSKVNYCWKNNFKEVKDQLLFSFDNFVEGNKNLTDYVSNICINQEKIKGELSKISNFYNMQKVYEGRIYEAQDMLSYELKNLHNIISQGIREVKKDIVIKVNYEKSLINKLNKFNIKYFDLVCYDENGKIKVKIILSHNVYSECKNDIVDIINLALNKEMVLQDESSQYVSSKKEVVLTYVEKYNYKIISHCIQLSKRDKNGDNYIFTKDKNDKYIIVLSDGIGSGIEAYDKSKFTVDLICKFVMTGLNLNSCINEIISIVSLKFFRDEAISTIDFSSIDLYNGKINYLKFFSVLTYVKRGNQVFVLESEKNLFEDNLQNQDNKIVNGEFQLEYGDIIVHLTDGLIHFNDLSHKAWLYNFLKKIDMISPDKLCEEIIREFKILNAECYQDDVTVIVSKVYKN